MVSLTAYPILSGGPVGLGGYGLGIPSVYSLVSLTGYQIFIHCMHQSAGYPVKYWMGLGGVHSRQCDTADGFVHIANPFAILS
jgi:hypothetical protein